jgi:hypothetical protein
MKIIFEIIIMVSSELSKIFFALKNYYDKKLVLHEKIARISVFSRNTGVVVRPKVSYLRVVGLFPT